ncbi:MAG: response regulator [candidate division NC10 bacterium]|nr:response regulator [candidate division NC10 bacterium]
MNPRSAKILVVDDDHLTVKVMQDLLHLHGYQVLTAYDGQEGLSLARAERPDLIILDVMMPKLDGFKVARLLKSDKLYRRIPIIILTVRAGEEDLALARMSGADLYLQKPFDPDLFLEKVRDFLPKEGS